jgi:archaeal flagellar protein FlaI
MNRTVLRAYNEPPSQTRILPPALQRLFANDRRSRPSFSQCWVSAEIPHDHKVLSEYYVNDAHVRLVSFGDELGVRYHIQPLEYELPKEQIVALNRVIADILANPPSELDLEMGAMRKSVIRLARAELAKVVRGSSFEKVTSERLESLAGIVARYTVGLGLFEILLSDDHVEDIFIDAPADSNPVHVALNPVDRAGILRCRTNIIASKSEVECLIARIRYFSGRPLSESCPILETDILDGRARATAISAPLSPEGPAIAFRRHSRNPWTLLRLVREGSLDCSTAALISFLIDGRSTILICGPRGAGKSSLLAASLFEFPRTQRILTIEDTPELPVRQMQSLGFKVQSLVVEQRSGESRENKTVEALRVSLRLGESAIVLGEVRGKEAQVLYESMRTGKAGSSVLGTIHGDSARSVYDRAIHDLDIHPEAFMATDVVMTLGLNRPFGTQQPVRRLLEVVEAKKTSPGEFGALVRYSPDQDRFEGTFQSCSDLIARIAASWNISYEEAIEDINARAEMRQILLDRSKSNYDYLGPDWTARANNFLWRAKENGERDYQKIVERFRAHVAEDAR